MTTVDPILNALALMEERLIERMEGWRRELRLDLDGAFDAVHKRLDRLEQEYEMLKAGVARIEADIGTLKADVGALKEDVAFLKRAVGRLEARQEEDASGRQDLREQALGFRRRLDELEERVQEIERRLPRD